MAKGQKKFNYIQYGQVGDAKDTTEFVEFILDSNLANSKKGLAKTPPCIWGHKGIGKTSIVEQIAEKRGWGYKYIAPAQFEEMGDLLGMPGRGYYIIKDEEEKLVTETELDLYIENGWKRDLKKDAVALMLQPEWVPTKNDPEYGILLIDDFNRADGRILNGLMQFLQKYEMSSWKLPNGWDIVLTANPDGGDYSVNSLDDAQLTRMAHCTLDFDKNAWAEWAIKKGVDSRGINFVLTYPEMVKGDRTTPRSLVQFFNFISGITDLKKDLGRVNQLAKACIDDHTANSFTAFINNNLTKLVSPEEILDTKNFKLIENQLKPFYDVSPARVDILSTVCTRVLNHCKITLNGDLNKDQMINLKNFIKLDGIPNDIRLSMAQDLVDTRDGGSQKLKKIMSDPAIGKMLLKRM